MKSVSIKKVVIIFSVLIVIVLSAIVIAFATGNTYYPSLSDPNGVFYERVDDNGNVVYTITNQEIFDEIKSNDGPDQALLMADAYLLQDYLGSLTDEQIQNKILEIEYGTSVQSEIDALDPADKATYEESYNQQIILAGYQDNPEEYASLVLARELYAREAYVNSGSVTDLDVASEYQLSYWNDINAIKIRFMSEADALDVLHSYHLITYDAETLRYYLGYEYADEDLVYTPSGATEEAIIEAYQTVTPYYFDNWDIYNLDGDLLYEGDKLGSYFDSSDNAYTLDTSGNLIDEDSTVIIEASLLFDSETEAIAYKDANTFYYTVTKTDPYDTNEDTLVYDENNNLAFTIDSDGNIYDASNTDVTDTTDLIVNKVYTSIDDVSETTLNNSTELTNEEILNYFVQMYNYVYGEYRDALPTDTSVVALIGLNNSDLMFNYDDVYAIQTSLATYMFKQLDASADVPYSPSPKAYAGDNDDSYYLIYKLSQPEKLDAYEVMLDFIENQIVLPSVVADDITLPTTGEYDSTISWASSSTAIIATDGTVTLPSEDTVVTLTYTITLNGSTRTGSVDVTVMPNGTTEEVTENTDTAPTFKEILNNDPLYDTLYNQLIDDYIYGDSSDTNISDLLIALRQEYNFTLYDYYVQLSYQSTDSDYVIDTKGSKTIFFSLSGYPGDDTAAYEVTADDFFNYMMGKNPSLYLVYAAQSKELIYSTYYTDMFGSQTDIYKNKTDHMQEMYDSITSVKSYYTYLKNLYESYGITFSYDSLFDYIYLNYGAKNEDELLKYFVTASLQPYLIDEGISNYDILTLLYPSVEDNFNNYFSLDAQQLLIYLDYNEDGVPDDYDEYIASLTQAEQDDFYTMLANLENAIENESDYETAVTAYQEASRSSATWGEFKSAGIYLLYEDLNTEDSDGNVVNVTYSTGDNAVKDTYVPAFTEELVNLYQEFQNPTNIDVDTLYGSVETLYGYHLIVAAHGDDYDKPVASFTEADPENPVYSDGSENSSDMPSMAQIELYAQYYFYNTIFDLTDADLESKYGITVPDLPVDVKTAISTYFDDQLANVYVMGMINIDMADRLLSGTAETTTYSSMTSEQLYADLTNISEIYYAALFADYLD